MPEPCPICAKHRGEGPLAGPVLWQDAVVVVSHLPTGEDGTAPLGYLFVETRRHVATIDALTGPEVTAVAHAVWRAARALRTATRPEHVFSAVIGTTVPHFHQHVFARPPGVPGEYGWMQAVSWPGFPRGDRDQLAELCARLARSA